MKKSIILVSFVSGVLVGFVFDRIVNKKSVDVSEEEERVETLTKEEPEEKGEDKKEVENISKENNYISIESIIEEENEEVDEDQEELEENIEYNNSFEEFRKKYGELIQKIDYDDAYNGYVDEFDVYDDYGSPVDLYWFPDVKVLTDDEGTILNPIENYMGEFIETKKDIGIRNNPLQKRFLIHSENNMTPDEFWG